MGKGTGLLRLLAALAVAFGLLTLYAGGRALFGGAAVRAELGHIVPFVLWFNFLAGFAYVAAGAGLLRGRRWAAVLAAVIAAATLLVFAAFAIHVLTGGAYEVRTVGAMTFRSAVWTAIAAYALRVTARR
ncbi:MAG: hypothetical protein H6906_00080 [Hyphomicrobiales bacterium]|nr:hypothetical protein [Hyphomicrobiales bacterium]